MLTEDPWKTSPGEGYMSVLARGTTEPNPLEITNIRIDNAEVMHTCVCVCVCVCMSVLARGTTEPNPLEVTNIRIDNAEVMHV